MTQPAVSTRSERVCRLHGPKLLGRCKPRHKYGVFPAFHKEPSSKPLAPCAGKGLVCVVWPHKAPNFPALPQRLGAVHCVNRPCGLWHVLLPDAGSAEEQVWE